MIASLISFVSRLTQRGKMVFYGVLVVLSLLMLDRLMRRPILAKMEELDKDIVKTEASIKKALGVISREEALLDQAVMYASYLKKVGSDDKEKLSLQNYIEILASKSSIKVGEVKAGLKRAEDGEEDTGQKTYVVKLTCEGGMDQLVSFFHDVEASKEKLLKIEVFSMVLKGRDSDTVICTMEITRDVIL